MKNLGGLLRVTLKPLRVVIMDYLETMEKDDDPWLTARYAKEMGELMFKLRQRAETQIAEERALGRFRLALPKNAP